MSTSTASIKVNHKAIAAYYETLKAYAGQVVTHETAVRSAFQNLLAETGKLHKWTLIPELTMKVKGKPIRPDGTMRDGLWFFPRGFWEAKDTDDKLDAEIKKKISNGYPTTNIIFEDTQVGVLYQNGKEVFRVKLDQPQELADLLNLFFNHTERDFEGFEEAVGDFKDRIPQLAGGFLDKITEAHKKNESFEAAFDSLLEVCQASLNPNISRAAVDEMLVQHLMTERLFERVFQNQDFVRRNVIAAEIEKVILALVIKSFNRHDFLKSLDPFYKAIEDTARTIEDFSEKQHFLNTVYERFFQGFSVKLADTHGIVYTPQAIADFMGASIVEILKTAFGLTLGSPGVFLLDPCTGTGNFAVNMMRRVAKKDLPRFYREQLFANEVMLLPYYVAAQNIEHEYFDITGEYVPFEGLCFVDTLELAEADDGTLDFMTEANTTRVRRQRKAPITIVVGNPPYNVGQLNENDNNKNRKYEIVDRRLRETYARDSKASSVSKVSDPYVKFFRWATDRLEGRDGIVCYVTNNSFVHKNAFDGMRKHLLQDFTRIYHLDLHGNVRENPKLSGTTHNVFGIQVGVGITVAVRSAKHKDRRVFYHRVPESWKKEQKLAWLSERKSIAGVDWEQLKADDRNSWLVPEYASDFETYIPIGSKETKNSKASKEGSIFWSYSLGVVTARDDVVYAFHRGELQTRLPQVVEDFNSEVDRYRRSAEDALAEGEKIDLDHFVRYDKVKWSEGLKLQLQRKNYAKYQSSKIRPCLYRPFSQRFLYYDRVLNEKIRLFPTIFPESLEAHENKLIILTGPGSEKPFMTLMTDAIVDYHVVGAGATGQCFPFYIYNQDGSNRRENLTDWALSQFSDHYGDDSITKMDIFHYIYGVLHQPGYRAKFADDLKRELPRIPSMVDFRAFSGAGEKLADLHLNYEGVEPWPLEWIESDDAPLSYRVEKMKLSKDKTTLFVNDTLTLAEIPPEAFQYRLGNRSALEWVIDQYQVSTDKRSGIVTDPNRVDDPEYIVRLVERVVRVSVETVEIVAGLPHE